MSVRFVVRARHMDRQTDRVKSITPISSQMWGLNISKYGYNTFFDAHIFQLVKFYIQNEFYRQLYYDYCLEITGSMVPVCLPTIFCVVG